MAPEADLPFEDGMPHWLASGLFRLAALLKLRVGPQPDASAAWMIGIIIAFESTWSDARRANPTANQTHEPLNPTLASQSGLGPLCPAQPRRSHDLAADAALSDGLGGIGSSSPGPAGRHARMPQVPPADQTTKRTSARLRIGTLNIKGYGAVTAGGASDKWMYINQVMRDQNLTVLAVQEAHLTQECLENLNILFSTSLEIYCSPDPNNSAGARGVAFVVNKRKLAGRKCTTRVLVPGRAMQLEYPWAADRSISVLNVYAPNAANENASFWTDLGGAGGVGGATKLDVVLGDFNVVESALDRFPAHPDPAAATEALSALLVHLHVCDSWCTAHPTDRLFTFRQAGSDRQSRLDRIYIKQSVMPNVADWATVGPGQLSDHQLVVCSIANYHAPVVGKGRWAAPLSLLDDASFVSTMKELGHKLEEDLADMPPRSETANLQVVFKDFKSALAAAARKRVK